MFKPVLVISALACQALCAANLKVDTSGVRPGPITVTAAASSLDVHWKDEHSRACTAAFSLTDDIPTIAAISVGGRRIVTHAQPFYRAETGKRRGGWDAFFDFPPSHPDGTRSFFADYKTTSISARSIGDRMEISFDGMHPRDLQRNLALHFLSRQPPHRATGRADNQRAGHRVAPLLTQACACRLLMMCAPAASCSRVSAISIRQDCTRLSISGIRLGAPSLAGPLPRHRGAFRCRRGERLPRPASIHDGSRLHHQHGLRLVHLVAR